MVSCHFKDISLEIIEKDGVMVGSDFEVEVKVKNIKKKRARRTVQNLLITVDSVKYTGDSRQNIIKKAFDDITLDFEEGEFFILNKIWKQFSFFIKKNTLMISYV